MVRKLIKSSPSVLAFVVLAGCSSEIPGETRLPRCEPRSNVDPARLNIDSTAEDFGRIDPCRAGLRFYISRNTELRAVEVETDFMLFEGERIASENFELEFPAARGGMLAETIELAPVEDHTCHELLVLVSRLACLDGRGNEIECPEVRLNTSYVFGDFTMATDGLDVCFD